MQIYRSSLVSIYFSALLKDASKKQLDLEVADVDNNHWLLVWNSHFFHMLGMSSSQLTFIFFRGVGSTTNQPIDVY